MSLFKAYGPDDNCYMPCEKIPDTEMLINQRKDHWVSCPKVSEDGEKPADHDFVSSPELECNGTAGEDGFRHSCMWCHRRGYAHYEPIDPCSPPDVVRDDYVTHNEDFSNEYNELGREAEDEKELLYLEEDAETVSSTLVHDGVEEDSEQDYLADDINSLDFDDYRDNYDERSSSQNYPNDDTAGAYFFYDYNPWTQKNNYNNQYFTTSPIHQQSSGKSKLYDHVWLPVSNYKKENYHKRTSNSASRDPLGRGRSKKSASTEEQSTRQLRSRERLSSSGASKISLGFLHKSLWLRKDNNEFSIINSILYNFIQDYYMYVVCIASSICWFAITFHLTPCQISISSSSVENTSSSLLSSCFVLLLLCCFNHLFHDHHSLSISKLISFKGYT